VQSFVYTGTHDNNTIRGWFEEELTAEDRKRISEYAGYEVNTNNINDTMIRFAYASVAKAAIIPLQDLLSLGADSRMNTPAKTEGNWLWRLSPGQLHDSVQTRLRHLTEFYNRSV
jgi:4-alpha-glucanotransferase